MEVFAGVFVNEEREYYIKGFSGELDWTGAVALCENGRNRSKRGGSQVRDRGATVQPSWSTAASFPGNGQYHSKTA